MSLIVVSGLVLFCLVIAFGLVSLRSPSASRASRLVMIAVMFGATGGAINLLSSALHLSDALGITGSIVGLCFTGVSAVYVRRAYRANAEARAARRST